MKKWTMVLLKVELTHHGTYLEVGICHNFFYLQPSFTDILHSSNEAQFLQVCTFSLSFSFVHCFDRYDFLAVILHESVSAILSTESWTIHPAISCKIFAINWIFLHYGNDMYLTVHWTTNIVTTKIYINTCTKKYKIFVCHLCCHFFLLFLPKVINSRHQIFPLKLGEGGLTWKAHMKNFGK